MRRYIDMKKDMPEVFSTLNYHSGSVDWVGMERVEMSILVDTDVGRVVTPASIDVFINLKDAHTRGIHMSRLYQTTFIFSQTVLDSRSIKNALEEFIDKHRDLSTCAKIRIRFKLSRKVPSLLSGQQGWRNYPIMVYAQLKQGKFSLQLGCEILYSSTCPCSSGLSRQLIQQNFSHTFGKDGLVSTKSVLDWIEDGDIATPHSQRSVASVFVVLNESTQLSYDDLIGKVRLLLPTEVQASVKREDEQDFARINGENLLFCEDACRKIAYMLQKDMSYTGYYVKVSHEESLHPHNAVSVVSKNFESI